MNLREFRIAVCTAELGLSPDAQVFMGTELEPGLVAIEKIDTIYAPVNGEAEQILKIYTSSPERS